MQMVTIAPIYPQRIVIKTDLIKETLDEHTASNFIYLSYCLVWNNNNDLWSKQL